MVGLFPFVIRVHIVWRLCGGLGRPVRTSRWEDDAEIDIDDIRGDLVNRALDLLTRNNQIAFFQRRCIALDSRWQLAQALEDGACWQLLGQVDIGDNTGAAIELNLRTVNQLTAYGGIDHARVRPQLGWKCVMVDQDIQIGGGGARQDGETPCRQHTYRPPTQP